MPGMNLTRQEAAERADVVTRVHSYDIRLDLTGSSRTFASTTTVVFDAVPGSSTFIDAITDSVQRVRLNGRDLDPAEVSDGVRIQLPELAESNELTVEAQALYTNTGEGLHRFVDPVDDEVYLYTQFEVPDSRRMHAVFEQPDLKAEFTFTVTAPAAWTVVSNQPVDSREEQGEQAVWRFRPTPRISSYITALVAGPYAKVSDSLTNAEGREIPLDLYARRSLIEHLDAEDIFTLTKQGFAFYEEQFGVPYPFEKYDQLFVPEFNAGAMENAGCVTILEDYIFRSKPTEAMVERRAITVLHELAHMWFGDLVTMKWWNDLWLNESFAEFMSHLAAVSNTRFTHAWTTFGASEKTWAYRQDQLPSTHPIVAPINDLQDVQVNFDGITYAKGASVLRQLVAWVGQEEFMRALRSYFEKHSWSNATLADLLAELESTSGRKLDSWSKVWLETAGVNTLTPSITAAEDGTLESVEVIQTAPNDYPTLRPHRMTAGFYDLRDGKLVRTHRVEFDVEGERTAIPGVAGRARPDLILLNDEDLAYAKVRLDERSFDTAVAHLRDFEESLPRAVVWGAAWDGTRDGQIPARQFVDLVLNNIDAETDSTSIMTQLRNLATTLKMYVRSDAQEATREKAAQRLWEIAQSAPAGSDRQLQFVQAFAAHATTEEQKDTVRALLEGQQRLEGLEIDRDLAWRLLIALAAAGRADEAEIDAAAAEDNTSTGAQKAAQAKAAIPTAEAKNRVWEQVVEHHDLPNVIQRSAIMGFNATTKSSLLRPFIPRYFAAIERVWQELSHEISQQIITGLFPQVVDRDVLEASEQFLSQLGEGRDSLRRQVIEGRDGIERALRVQAADVIG
ncbi:aminopeptidase N [Rothia kristinae]|uniref:aminopeptidase N n=1 Tax=Rothia kristinae TaxID=37923 RepID=UPI001CD72132|nr:aminopeptidase N [Rothia kristinae]MCA1169430.1 aminopeptidase N [Rothia kristinae]MCT1357874.1 aminopeptidase N [Rothia kristinae]MCT1393350.1 aminopeptidase N [Rothia kristinae]MCT1505891.1 aminopeptidase N [Rothia kristinae]MCT2039174.1 aminopeptidase N [Rothia kristinae]